MITITEIIENIDLTITEVSTPVYIEVAEFGIQGQKGDKGDKGDVGSQGIQGIQGIKGDVGSVGSQGLKGDTGLQGLKGDTGLTGSQGIQGLKGDIGLTGLQGIQGIKGDTGTTGATGTQGLKGDTGLQGATGAQGIQGINGADGVTQDISGKIGGTGTTNKLAKFTASGTVGDSLVFDNGTNVGIGTTSPTYKLDVYGVSKITNDFANRGGALISTKEIGGVIYLYNDNGSATGAVRLRSSYLNGGTLYNPNFSIERSTNSVAYGGNIETLTFATSVTIDGSSGNVGIGTTTPQAKLNVYGGAILNQSISGFSDYVFGNADGGLNSKYSYIGGASNLISFGKINDDLITKTEFARFFYNGNFLINTTSDNGVDKLQVSGNISIPIGSAFKMYDASGSGWAQMLYDNTLDQISFNRGANFNGTASGSPATLSNQFVVKSQLDLKQNTLTNPTTGVGSNLDPNAYALQDGTILYHSTKWFVPTGAVSTSGTTVTSIGTQFLATMVGAKLTINGEWRIISAFTSSTNVTVSSAYSVNYSGVVAGNWGVYSKSEYLNGTFKYFLNSEGGLIFRAVAGNSVGFANGVELTGNAGFYADNFTARSDYKFVWSSTSSPFGTRDIGFRRNNIGTLEIYDGITADGLIANRRDLLVRNTLASKLLIGTTSDNGALINTQGTVSASSAIARGEYLAPTLVATQNNDVLVGLDINPTFTTGGFTGVNNIGLRVNGRITTLSSVLELYKSNGIVIYADNSETTLMQSQTNGRMAFRIGASDMGRFLPTTGNLTLQNGGTFTDIPSARLQVNSTTQGVLLPRMTTAQVNAIVSPVQGLTVFNTDLNTLCFYTTSWQKVSSTTM